MPAAAAQLGPLPWRVNCGDDNGQALGQPGWLLLSETAAPTGITLVPKAVDTVHVAQAVPPGYPSSGIVLVPSDVYTLDPDMLSQTHLLTSLQLADNTLLTIGGLSANQPYRVRLELGAVSPWLELPSVTWGPTTVSRQVRVEEKTPGTSQWRTLVKDVRCATSTTTNTLATELGGIVPVWCRVHADASGVVQLRFSTDGPDPVFIAGFEVHAWEALPVVYKHSAAGPLQSTQPALAGFVAAFNAHDYDGAQQIALALADPWLRGSALCHLIGWLDGTRDGRFHLIDEARAALVSAQPTHVGAAWLIDQLDQLQRALDHLDARGYASAKACPEEGGKGFLNKDCAGQIQLVQGVADTNVNAFIAWRLLSGLCAPATGDTVLADIKAWNAGSGGTAGWEPGPLVFAALKACGTTIAIINPKLSVVPEPESEEMFDRFRDIFQFGFLDPAYDVGDFPKDMELHLYRRYAELGSHPFFWDMATLDTAMTDAQIDASWWGTEVADIPDAPVASWANKQRDVLAAYRNIVEYWLTERLVEGEVGGGLGDDVELMQVLAPAYAGQQDQGSRRQLDALDLMARHVFDAAVVDGYYALAMADVEHTAEYTTDVGQTLRGAFGHTRMALLNGFGVGQHLVDASNPAAAWAAKTVLGRLHLKSWFFTTTGPDSDPEHAFDVSLNGRALFPAVVLGGHSPLATNHPLLTDLRDWAAGWREDALSTSGGKPAGFFGPIAWPSNEFGSGGTWWSTKAGDADAGALSKSEVSYTLELMRMAYRTSTAADRWRYLLPAVRMFRSSQQWEDQGQPSAAAGSANWSAKLFRNGPRFHALVVSHLQDLAADPYLTTTDDPSLAGSAPYVDAVLLARMHLWAEDAQAQALSGSNLALAFALTPVLPCDPLNATNKPLGDFLAAYDQCWPYMRLAYPLLTKHAMHTDRVFLNRGQMLANLVAGHTGGNLVEGVPQRPALRWVGRVGEPLDLAVAVNGKGWDETWISAFVHNFDAQPVTLDLWLDEGLVPGEYRIDVGPPTSKCDQFAAGTVLTTSWADKRGAGQSVPLTLPAGTSLVRVVRDGASSAPAGRWDLALDPPELEIQKHDGLADLVLRARVANVGADPSPSGTLTFRASLTMPDGTSLVQLTGEVVIGTLALPALAASGNWQPAESTLELHLPFTQLLADILVAGLGVQVRADIEAGDGDWDHLNNSLSRLWVPGDIPLITIFQ